MSQNAVNFIVAYVFKMNFQGCLFTCVCVCELSCLNVKENGNLGKMKGLCLCYSLS